MLIPIEILVVQDEQIAILKEESSCEEIGYRLFLRQINEYWKAKIGLDSHMAGPSGGDKHGLSPHTARCDKIYGVKPCGEGTASNCYSLRFLLCTLKWSPVCRRHVMNQRPTRIKKAMRMVPTPPCRILRSNAKSENPEAEERK